MKQKTDWMMIYVGDLNKLLLYTGIIIAYEKPYVPTSTYKKPYKFGFLVFGKQRKRRSPSKVCPIWPAGSLTGLIMRWEAFILSLF